MSFSIRAMIVADCSDAISLWQRTEGLDLNECDTVEGLSFYLKRNPGLSFVSEDQGQLVGVVLCGHDGRRGTLRHLAVDKAYRGQGMGRELADCALRALHDAGVGKCNLYVEDSNPAALAFWRAQKWNVLEYTFRMMQTETKIFTSL